MELCSESLWNTSVSWDTDSPRLSSCLESLLEVGFPFFTALIFVCCSIPRQQVAAGSLLPLLILPWFIAIYSSQRQELQDAPQGGRGGVVLILVRCLNALLLAGLSLAILLTKELNTNTILELAAVVLVCCSSAFSCIIEVFLRISLKYLIFIEVVSAWRGKHTSLLLTIYWAFLLLALLPQVTE